jgi:hypothetical protein
MTPPVVQLLRRIGSGRLRLRGNPAECEAVKLGYVRPIASGEAYEFDVTLTAAGQEALDAANDTMHP